jgi:hypothetical protein
MAMYLSVGPVSVIILMLLLPVIWAVWWFVAVLGERSSSSHSSMWSDGPA